MSNFLSLKNITYGYSHTPVITDVNLEVKKGEMIGLLGRNGSGKTTLLKIIAGLIKPWSGSIEFYDKPLSNNNKPTIGYMPQVEKIDWDFPITVEEVVAFGIWKDSIFPWFKKDIIGKVHLILREFNLYNYSKSHINELSGGEQQKVFLARALITHPDLLLLDEPTSRADYNSREEILEILKSFNKEMTTIILTTHDIKGVAEKLPKIICLNKQIIAEGDPKHILTLNNLIELYG
ncbi:MAG: metal ABC transporter ATP-binding protein [Candidatus Nitrosocaldaceae archaeon]